MLSIYFLPLTHRFPEGRGETMDLIEHSLQNSSLGSSCCRLFLRFMECGISKTRGTYLPLVLDWVVYGKFEDTKGVIRSRKSKKDRNYNRQSKKKDNKTNYGSQNTTQKTKVLTTRI